MSIFSFIGKAVKSAVKVVGKVAAGVLGVGDLFSSKNQASTPSQATTQTTTTTPGTSNLQSYILPVGLGALAFWMLSKKR